MELKPNEQYSIGFDAAGGRTFQLDVHLSAQFPNEAPHLEISPLLPHPWVQPGTGVIQTAPGLVNVSQHTIDVVTAITPISAHSSRHTRISDASFRPSFASSSAPRRPPPPRRPRRPPPHRPHRRSIRPRTTTRTAAAAAAAAGTRLRSCRRRAATAATPLPLPPSHQRCSCWKPSSCPT